MMSSLGLLGTLLLLTAITWLSLEKDDEQKHQECHWCFTGHLFCGRYFQVEGEKMA